MTQQISLDKSLIQRYDTAGPRYTSYPTALQFGHFTAEDYTRVARASNLTSIQGTSAKPLSLYFHIPFCDTVCFYCGCSKIATKDRNKSAPYLSRVYQEMAMQATLFDQNRPVTQLHWGGGTPTFISLPQMRELMQHTAQHFQLLDDDSGEYSIEIDPREVSAETISTLREIGFNRMSLGVQDVNPVVQKAVNRIQPITQTANAVTAARKVGFKSISFDLIYGLPFQSLDGFKNTLDTVLDLDPDRFSVFNYAHLPHLFKPQRRINEKDLPSAAEKLDILDLTIERLQNAGYIYIGMDHFAKPNDELAIAQQNGTLYRNFQGYSTQADCDLIAFGVTSISKVGNSYSQNAKTIDEYFNHIDQGNLPVFRGIELTADDLLRRHIISQLMCHFELNFDAIDKQFGINFRQLFSPELAQLGQMRDDGLLRMDESGIFVTANGRLLIRNICMVFDAYLGSDKHQFSKVI